MPKAMCIGIAFDEQLVGAIAHESHDHHMDLIVTPTRVIRCAGEVESA